MNESPEIKTLRIGVVPLADAAPLVVACARGFFAAQGLEVELSVEASWASIRDKVAAGLLDAAQMLAPMPLAATLGLDGVGVPMVTGLSLNLNGNAITVSEPLYRALRLHTHEAMAAGHALKAVLAHDRVHGRGPRVFAHVFPFSAHHYQLRHWLAAAGIDPDRDLRLEVVPPPLMVQHLRDGRIDGFCVGAPWGAVAEAAGVGQRIVSGYQIWNNAPEKVLGVTRAWADAHPATHRALIAALIAAARWLDSPAHRLEAAQVLIERVLLDAPPATLRAALARPPPGDPFAGAGLVFHDGAAGFPWRSHAHWFITQMQRWQQLDRAVDAATVARAVYRPELFRAAAQRVGAPCPTADSKAENQHATPWRMAASEGELQMGADLQLPG